MYAHAQAILQYATLILMINSLINLYSILLYFFYKKPITTIRSQLFLKSEAQKSKRHVFFYMLKLRHNR